MKGTLFYGYGQISRTFKDFPVHTISFDYRDSPVFTYPYALVYSW